MNPFTTNNARLLSDEQLQKTHEASLEILQEVGMEVHNGTAREVYARHGCDVDNEISLMLKRVARGMEVSKENISLDEIIEVGPGSMFLETEQTFARMEDTALFPDVADRDTRQAWEEKGGHAPGASHSWWQRRSSSARVFPTSLPRWTRRFALNSRTWSPARS